MKIIRENSGEKYTEINKSKDSIMLFHNLTLLILNPNSLFPIHYKKNTKSFKTQETFIDIHNLKSELIIIIPKP